MNSRVIKFVAGAGKTTYSANYLKENNNGLYLAFNNSVVDEISKKGFLARTIDSFFQSYLIPKFTSTIPIIANGSNIEYYSADTIPEMNMDARQVRILDNGDIYFGKYITPFSLSNTNSSIHSSNLKYSHSLKFVFGKDTFRITDELRSGLALYLLKQYKKDITYFIESRFSYVIIDEAQDLSGYKEEFAKILYESKVKLLVLGDENQNINGGGPWFETILPDETNSRSYRCPDDNCKWIRDNLGITIFGNNHSGGVSLIKLDAVKDYDDGKRTLLYYAKNSQEINEIIDTWSGPKETIKKSKGETICEDILIVAKTLSKKFYYTAVTRTRKKVFSTINKIKD